MSMGYIRRHYGVPAQRGMQVRLIETAGRSRTGRIVAARGHYLRVRFDGERLIRSMHPTWRIEYVVTGNRASKP